MANNAIDMSKLKKVLRLFKNGSMSNRKIAEAVELDKNTVNKYINQAKKDSLSVDELLALDDPVLAHRMTGGNAAYSDSRFDELKDRLPYYASELRRPHVTMQLLWEEYRKETAHPYGITQFKEHLNRYIAGSGEKGSSTILKDLYVGGEKAFLDFAGGKMQYVDIDTGEVREVEIFVATLPATDYGFATAVPSQRVEDFLTAVERFFEHIGGVPKILVPDNLKSAVIKRENGMPVLNKLFDDFCNHYGCVAIPARPVHPKDKSGVEDHVRIFYRRVVAPLRNETFYSIEELNAAISRKMRESNQRRMHQRPQTREELFLAIEKPHLMPLPETRYEVKFYTKLTVKENCCVYLGRDMHYYSVPYKYVGFQMTVIYTATLVKIYKPDGEFVRCWDRDRRPGEYTTEPTDMASNSQAFRMRSPSYYIVKSKSVSTNLGIVVEAMFGRLPEGTPPEVLYNRCDALLRLQRNTEPRLFELACENAIRFERYSYKFIDHAIKSKCLGILDACRSDELDAPPEHENIRGVFC